MNVIKSLHAAIVKTNWPNLNEKNSEDSSEPDPFYNCIAFVFDDDEHRWWPVDEDGYYWPPNYPREESLANVIATFEGVGGFSVCETEALEHGYEKIAIYAIANEPVHVAKQLSDGRWASKIGIHEDILHDTPKALNGIKYGQALIFMRRLKNNT